MAKVDRRPAVDVALVEQTMVELARDGFARAALVLDRARGVGGGEDEREDDDEGGEEGGGGKAAHRAGGRRAAARRPSDEIARVLLSS
jgi:hypothetical protein